MRSIIVTAFVSLDGVMQAPGGPEEDPTGGFRYGGWTVPYSDDVISQGVGESFGRPFDLLLGRKTYDIFAAYWPHIDVDPASSTFNAGEAAIANSFNSATKHVASRSRSAFAWSNSRWLGEDAVTTLGDLKSGSGQDLMVWGSSDFVQTLLAADLIDEIRLLTYPLALGKGKRLFGAGTLPAAFKLARSIVSPSGVVIAAYERAGDVRTGSFAPGTPCEAELERRKNLA